MKLAEPSDGNDFHAAHALRLLESYRRLSGNALLPTSPATTAVARELYFAPFVVLSHDTAADPLFTYANLAAQRLFEMPWAEIVGMPSRYSAEPLARDERQRLLERVTRNGYIDDYRGVRVSRSGKRFLIEKAVVWNVADGKGHIAGQAATFSRWTEVV